MDLKGQVESKKSENSVDFIDDEVFVQESENSVTNANTQNPSDFQSLVPKILKTKPISLSSVSNKDVWNLRDKMTDSEKVVEMELPQPQETYRSTTEPLLSTPNEVTKPTSTINEMASEKKDKSPLEATFTHPAERLDDETSLRVVIVGSSSDKKKGKRKASYTALEFASSSSQTNSLTLSINADEDKHLTHEVIPIEDERLSTALLSLCLSAFCPLWALGIAFWHFVDGNFTASLLSLIILGISVLAVHVAYFSAKLSPKSKIWGSSKCIGVLCAIPGLPSTILGISNCVFAAKEAQCRSFERPWSNTRFVFLVESLALAFPSSVLLLVLLAEDVNSIPSYKGYVSVIAFGIMSFAITFHRFRHDQLHRYDRFGSGLEKYIRFTYIWANKVLWLVTYALVIVSFRLILPSQKTLTAVGGIALIILFFEVPLLGLRVCSRASASESVLGLLMMVPQFLALASLIVYVNVDPTVYAADNGCFILGIFFYAEAIILTGWLYDRCTGREIDFIPIYPHFFGDLLSSIAE